MAKSNKTHILNNRGSCFTTKFNKRIINRIDIAGPLTQELNVERNVFPKKEMSEYSPYPNRISRKFSKAIPALKNANADIIIEKLKTAVTKTKI